MDEAGGEVEPWDIIDDVAPPLAWYAARASRTWGKGSSPIVSTPDPSDVSNEAYHVGGREVLEDPEPARRLEGLACWLVESLGLGRPGAGDECGGRQEGAAGVLRGKEEWEWARDREGGGEGGAGAGERNGEGSGARGGEEGEAGPVDAVLVVESGSLVDVRQFGSLSLPPSLPLSLSPPPPPPLCTCMPCACVLAR